MTMALVDTAVVETWTPTVQLAQQDDTQRVLDTLTLAFAADPAVRWMYPDPQQYLQSFPAFAHAFGGRAIARRTAFISEGYSGAALWLPPDTAPDEEGLTALLEKSVSDRDPYTIWHDGDNHVTPPNLGQCGSICPVFPQEPPPLSGITML
jgi:hypothetical protein